MNAEQIQDRKERHEYLKAKSNKKELRDEVDRIFKAWAALFQNDSREISNDMRYRCVLGELSKAANQYNGVHDEIMMMYDPAYLETIDSKINSIRGGESGDRMISLIVNNYRTFLRLDRLDHEIERKGDTAAEMRNKERMWLKRCKDQKVVSWCSEWGVQPSGYSKMLTNIKDKFAKILIK